MSIEREVLSYSRLDDVVDNFARRKAHKASL